jgi:hypothetical protein
VVHAQADPSDERIQQERDNLNAGLALHFRVLQILQEAHHAEMGDSCYGGRADGSGMGLKGTADAGLSGLA